MNCNAFQNWLITRDTRSGDEPSDILEHTCQCGSCKELYLLDSGLEKGIIAAFEQQQMPDGLVEQVNLALDHTEYPVHSPARPALKKIVGICAGIVFLAVLAILMTSNRHFHYKDLQQISEAAVARHLAMNTQMSFTADEVESAVIQMSRELKFNVLVPDLSNQGFILLGGRLCTLGKCRIAYFFYEKENRISSLFILDYDNLGFEMADGSRFSNDLKGVHTDIWKKSGQVYAMVY